MAHAYSDKRYEGLLYFLCVCKLQLQIVNNEKSAAAFVTFNRPPDVRKALQRDQTFLGGFKVIANIFSNKINFS